MLGALAALTFLLTSGPDLKSLVSLLKKLSFSTWMSTLIHLHLFNNLTLHVDADNETSSMMKSGEISENLSCPRSWYGQDDSVIERNGICYKFFYM